MIRSQLGAKAPCLRVIGQPAATPPAIQAASLDRTGAFIHSMIRKFKLSPIQADDADSY